MEMRALLNICWIILILKLNLTRQLYVAPIWIPVIHIIPPSGIRFIIFDKDYTLVAFHYSINEPLYNVDPGQWNFDVTEKIDNLWVHENRRAGVGIGDTINYWITVRPNLTRIDEQLLNQTFVIRDLSATTTSLSMPTGSTTTVVTTPITVGVTTNAEGTKSFTTLPATSGPTSNGRERATPTTTLTDVIRSTSVTPTSEFNDYVENSFFNLTYLIVFSTLGVIFMLCVTVIVVCCIRQRNYRTGAKQIQKSNEHFKNNLSDNVFQGQGLDRDNRNRNIDLDHVTLNDTQYNASTRSNIPGVTPDEESNSRTVSRHVYDAVDYNINPVASQYDYTDSQREVYDMPKDFLNQFKQGNKYDVLSRNRGDNQNQYQTIYKDQKASYLELV